jgi:hypothetical protein
MDFRESKYETKLRDEWGFVKNLKRADWLAIDHRVSKRKRSGKEYEVFFHEVRISPKKLCKEISRSRGAPGHLQTGKRFSRNQVQED